MSVAIADLAYGYRNKPVGRGVSLAIEPGRVTVLLGPNGSGKTTLFKTVLGLLPAQGGNVEVDGAALARMGRRAVARVIAYVPQATEGFFPFTVLDTVLMGRTAHLGVFQQPGRRDRAVAMEGLELLGIAHLAEQPYTRISGGERQLTLIARALAQETPYLVMDEPTASLDFGNQVRVLDQILKLADAGHGIVLSTHQPDHAFICADRVAVIHGGRLYALGAPDEVVTEATLNQVYGVRVALRPVAGAYGRSGCGLKIALPLSRDKGLDDD
jgi:iron complex transport system ATP-binding protein